jgi:hypothetical protein
MPYSSIKTFASIVLAVALMGCGFTAGCNRSSASDSLAHLRIVGTSFVTPEERPFQWRGITAFRLLEYVARGKDTDVEQFLSWAEVQRLTVIRVLAMGQGFMNLSPEEGRAALPRLLEAAARHKLHVEIVALAGTRDVKVDLDSHLTALGEIASNHGNAIIEIANEPSHPSQSDDIHRPEVLARLRSRVAPAVPVALGLVEGLERRSAGDYVTWHSPRDDRFDGWGHVLALAEGPELVRRWNKPVVSDEPIGAGEKLEPGRRDDSPARFRAAAVVTRLVGLGATFHYEGGLQAIVPAGRQLECFNAWNDAWMVLPADVERSGTFQRAGDPGAAVVEYRTDKALGVFERQRGNTTWVAVINPGDDFAMRWAPSWNPQQTRRLAGVWLINARRDARQPLR